MARLKTSGELILENQKLKNQISRYKQVARLVPYLDDSTLKGGYRIVHTIEDRDAIDCCYRKQGMIVVVIGETEYKEYRLTATNCSNEWEEIVTSATEITVDLVEDYSELAPNLETQRDLNQIVKQMLLEFDQQLENLELIDSKIKITEDNNFVVAGSTQLEFNNAVSDYAEQISAVLQSMNNTITVLNNAIFDINSILPLKLDKTTTTVTGPDTNFKYVYLTNDNNETRRMLAGDLGKNIANSNLTSIPGAGMNLGATYTWNVAGQFFYMTGLPNKSSDSTFNRILMQDNNAQMSYSDGKLWFMNIPTLMTVTERNDWITKMNVDIANTYLQLITVIDGNFINGTTDFIITIYGLNINALNGLTQVTFELIGPDSNPVPDNMFDVTSYSVNSNNELAVSFTFNPSYTFMTGEYTLKIIKQLVVLGEVGITAYNSFTEANIPDGDFTLTNNGMASATYASGSFNVGGTAGNAKIVTTNALSPAQDYDIEYIHSGVFRENNFGAGNQNYWITSSTGLTLDGTNAYIGSGTFVIANGLNVLTGGSLRIMTGATSSLGYTVNSDEAPVALTLKTVIQKRSNRYKVIIYRSDNNALLYAGTYTNTSNVPIYFMIQFVKGGSTQNLTSSAINVRKRIYI